MQMDKACSADAARETAFVRPHCAPRITKVHSAAAYAAPAQSPSATLNGYNGTALFHHAAYAASYTARSAMWQATPLATPGAVPTRQRLDMLNGGLQEQARISGREISFACDAIIMNSTLSCTTSLGPPVGDPTAMYAPPLRYKRVALAAHTEHTSSLRLSRGKTIQHTVDVGYYAPEARTTLIPMCSSCS